MKVSSLGDEEIVERCRSANPGDRRHLLDELFGRYYNRVALWCFRYSGDRERAADLAQEVFLRVQQNLDSFRGSAKFSTWLYTVARNHCFNSSPRPSQKEELGEDVLPLIPDTKAPNPEQATEQKDLSARMHELLNQALDETERHVFTLHFAEEMSLDEITRMLALDNTSGAKAYIVSARRKLARAVERWKARQGTQNVA
ncbi:MAG: sigma-70 family RNA polymerase sigma factor [Bryobacteraceae bacterium]